MITLRLDPTLEQTLKTAAENLGVTKSELIRRSIQEYLGQLKQPNAWEAGQELFGKYSSGQGTLSAHRKEIIQKKIKAKRG